MGALPSRDICPYSKLGRVRAAQVLTCSGATTCCTTRFSAIKKKFKNQPQRQTKQNNVLFRARGHIWGSNPPVVNIIIIIRIECVRVYVVGSVLTLGTPSAKQNKNKNITNIPREGVVSAGFFFFPPKRKTRALSWHFYSSYIRRNKTLRPKTTHQATVRNGKNV